MLFRFIDSIYPPNGTIRAGTTLDLTNDEATLYAGKAFNHLEPLDPEAKAFLSELKGEKPAVKEPTRVELIEEAKALGIKGADSMKKDDLSAAIAEAKA